MLQCPPHRGTQLSRPEPFRSYGRDKGQSASAIDLPIALAVKLLENPREEIHITVPVSGSLDDPQFSVGGLIWHAVKDLILKIVESLLNYWPRWQVSKADPPKISGTCHFPPAWPRSPLQPRASFLTVAKAMQRRPELRMTLTPRVDPSTDRPGLSAVLVDRLVKMQKVEELTAQGASPMWRLSSLRRMSTTIISQWSTSRLNFTSHAIFSDRSTC